MIALLRLNHRIKRDERATTHVMLSARAFLAEKAFYSGDKDSKMEEGVRKVAAEWGGNFGIEYTKSPKKVIEEWGKTGLIVHLTMYGIPLNEKIGEIRREEQEKGKDVLVVVGGAKVPFEFFQLSDFNVSVTLQPHSEIAALAVFLHELNEGRELAHAFGNAQKRIIPQEKGKKFE